MTRKRLAAFLAIFGSFALAGAVVEVAASPDSVWTAASGQLPTQVCPAWVLVDDASPEDPALAGGRLTLSTDVTTETMFYRQSPPLIDFPAGSTTTIVAAVRFVSGSHTNAARRATGIFFNTGALGNSLYIGQDEVFLLTGVTTAGVAAARDTDGAVHTYRIVIAIAADNTTGTVNVFYDAEVAPILTGSLFADPSPTQVAWGDGTVEAFGVSEWTSFTHNADRGTAPPCTPTAVTLRSLNATRAANGVLVHWRTASEVATLGFHVYREVNGRRVPVTRKLVPARGASGRTYSYLDRRAPRRKALHYWIQVVNLDGSRRWYGPARVAARS